MTSDSETKPFLAALFDFDETMVDLEPQHDAAHRALCQAYGSDYDALPVTFRFGSGRRIIDDIREMHDFFGWSESEETLNHVRHQHFLAECRTARLSLMPGVERLVRSLQAAGLRLAITSSADGDAIDEILRRFELRGCFELIVDGARVSRGKPDPEGYLLTAKLMGVAPPACVVFEDSRAGVLAARGAGMYCIAVRNPAARMHQDLTAANVVLTSFEDLDEGLIAGARSGR
jgi:beta-phosphoglucomutase